MQKYYYQESDNAPIQKVGKLLVKNSVIRYCSKSPCIWERSIKDNIVTRDDVRIHFLNELEPCLASKTRNSSCLVPDVAQFDKDKSIFMILLAPEIQES